MGIESLGWEVWRNEGLWKERHGEGGFDEGIPGRKGLGKDGLGSDDLGREGLGWEGLQRMGLAGEGLEREGPVRDCLGGMAW